jgi:sortase A
VTTLETRPLTTAEDEVLDRAIGRLAVAVGANSSRLAGSTELAAWAARQPDLHRALGRLVLIAGSELASIETIAAAPAVIAAPGPAETRATTVVPMAPEQPPGPQTEWVPPGGVAIARPGPALSSIGPPAGVRPICDPEFLAPQRARQARAFLWVEVTGMLILAFLVYQWWGTGFEQRRAQQELRAGYQKGLTQSPTPPLADGSTVSGPTSGRTASVVPRLPGGALARLEIPAIHLDQFVVEGTSESDLRRGPGHYPGSPLPGQPGNAAIAGHRTTFGAPFSRLDELKAGDTIIATTAAGRFLYVMSHELVVSPGQTSVVDDYGDSRLTLTTCTPKFSATARLIAVAILRGPAPRTSLPARTTAPGPVASHAVLVAGPAAAVLRHHYWGPKLDDLSWLIILGMLGTAIVVLQRRLRRRLTLVRVTGVLAPLWLAMAALALTQLSHWGFNMASLPLGVGLAGLLVGLGLLYRPVRRRVPPLAAATLLAPIWVAVILLLFEQLTRLLPPNV